MLLKLRGGLDSIFVTVLLGLLIAAFAIWGIGPGMLSGSSQSVAKVGDTEVSTNRFFNNVVQRAQQLQIQFGGDFSTPQLVQMMQLDQQVLAQMLVDAAVKEHLSTLGLRATDAQLAAALREIEAFQMPDGSFSPQLMEQALRQNNISQLELFEDLRSSVTRSQLLESFIVEDMIPRELANELHVWRGERRRAALINFAASDLTDVPAPTEEDVTAHYEANKEGYMTPERRSYNYLLLTPDYFAPQVEIPEGEIERRYEARADQYAASELRAVYNVSFNSQADAADFVAAVAGGADFIEAAVERSDFAANEIDLGDNTRQDLEAEFGAEAAAIVFGLEEGAPSAPVEDLGLWNVYMVPSITRIEGRSLDEVRAELEADYRSNQAIDLMFDYQDRIDDALETTSDLAEVATAVGLQVASVTGVDARGQNAGGFQVITQQNEFIVQSAAFREEIGIEPLITDINPTDVSAGFYLFEVTDIAEPAEQALEDVRARVEADWTRAARQERAGELADSATERLRTGASPEAIAEELGGTSFEAKNVARTGDSSSSLSANIRRLVFDLKVGEIDSEAAADGDGYVVVQVLEATAGNPETADTAVNTLLDQLNANFQEELFVQYQAYLTDLYPPEVNQQLIQQLFNPDNFQQ